MDVLALALKLNLKLGCIPLDGCYEHR